MSVRSYEYEYENVRKAVEHCLDLRAVWEDFLREEQLHLPDAVRFVRAVSGK
jgi:hypothetical protein